MRILLATSFIAICLLSQTTTQSAEQEDRGWGYQISELPDGVIYARVFRRTSSEEGLSIERFGYDDSLNEVEELHIVGEGYVPGYVVELFRNAPALTKLYLNGTMIGPGFLEVFSESKTLEEMLFYNYPACRLDLGPLCSFTCSLKELFISGDAEIYFTSEEENPDIPCLVTLTSLIVRDDVVTYGEFLAEIAQMEELKFLALESPGIHWDFSEITQLKKLEYLSLEGTEHGDDLAQLLKDLPRLMFLNLSNTRITDKGLAYISEVTSLKVLYLAQNYLTVEGLSHLSRLQGLLDLNLAEVPVGDDIIPIINSLPELQQAWLGFTFITDEGLLSLSESKSLEALLVGSSRGKCLYIPASPSALAELNERMGGRLVEHYISVDWKSESNENDEVNPSFHYLPE